MRRGFRARLVLTHVVVAAVAVAVVAVAVAATAERRFERYLSEARERHGAGLVETLEQTYRSETGWDARAIFALSRAAHVAGVNLAVYGADGRLEFTVEGVTSDDAAPTAASPTAAPLRASSFDVGRHSVVVDGRQVATVEIYAPRDGRSEAEAVYADARLRDLLVAVAVAVGLAAAVSLLVSRRLTMRLEELADVATDVTAGNLDTRVAPCGEDEVATLAAAFTTMADALARNEEARREMTVDLSDALHTPLAAVHGQLRALESGALAPTSANLRAVGEEVDRLADLLGALRTLNGLESRDVELALAPADLADIARETVTRIEAKAGRRAVAVSAAPTPVRADRALLLLAVKNLLDNALRFTPEGGTVTVTVAEEPPGTARLDVRDMGPAVDPVDLPFVFDRFYRCSGARGTQAVGLGLAVAKAVVDAHGGSIDAANAEDGGAVFTLRLPLEA